MGGRVLRQAAFSGGRKRGGWGEVERPGKFLYNLLHCLLASV
jgi:hypothetical protein